MIRKNDPSGTNPIIRQFEKQLIKRFNWLKKEMKKYVVSLLDETNLNIFEVPLNPYPFATSSEKMEMFSEWIKQMEDQGVLHSIKGPGQTVVGYEHWSDLYIETSYKKGMRDAYSYGKYASVTNLKFSEWINAAFYTAIHADRVGLLYSRTYNDLKGITEATDTALSRKLAQGMAEGKNPNVIAKEMAETIDDIGIKRAKLISRTEVMRAHAEAGLNTYESFNEEGLSIMVEWSAAKDERTCPRCIAMAYENGKPKVYTIEEARGKIPLHPNCRCVWIPVV